MNIGTMIATLGVDVRGLATAQVAMTRFEKNTVTSLNAMAQRFRTFGYLASVALTVPIIMAGKSSIKAASDFEFSMQKIVGLAGVAQETVNEWSKALLKMGPELARSPQELAEALYFIASSGIKSSQALEVLRIAAKGATAGLGETADVAKLLVFAMNAYKASNLSAIKIADQLTVAVREGAIEAEGFAGAVQSVIPIASAVGVSLGQVLGTMAAMSLQGASAANAAVYLKGILNSILKIKSSNQAGKALIELGSSGAKLKEQLGNGPNGLMNVLLQIQKWSKTNPELLYKVFGNIRALTGDLSLVGDNLKDNQKVINDVVNAYGDLDKASAAVANTIKVRMDIFASSSKAAWIKFGESIFVVLEPVLKWLVKALNNVIQAFDSLSQTTRTIIVVIGMLAAAAGPVALLISLLMYMTPAILALGKAFLWLETAMLGINVWVALAAVIGVVGLAIYRHVTASNELQKAQEGINRQIGAEIFSLNGVFTKLKTATKGTDERTAAIKIINERYGPYLKNLLTEKSSLEDIEKAQKDATNALVANISVKGYKEQLEKVLGVISSSFDKQFKPFVSAFGTSYGGDRIGEFITALFKGADDALKLSGGKFEKGVMGYSQTAETIWTKFIKPISQQTGYIKYSLGDFQKAFLNFLDTKSDKTQVVETLTAMISQFQDLTTGTNDLKGSLGGVIGGFDDVGASVKNLHKLFLEEYEAQLKAEKGFYRMEFTYKFNKKTGLGTSKIGGGIEVPKFDETNFTKFLRGAGALGGWAVSQSDAMIELAHQLDFVNKKEELLGTGMNKRKDLYNSVTAKIQAYSSALEKLLNDPTAYFNTKVQTEIKTVSEALNQLQLDFDALERQKMVFDEIGKAASSMAAIIGTSLVNSSNAWQNMAEVVLSMGQKIINTLLEQAIATLFLASATIAEKEIASKGLLGLITAAIGIGVLIALVESSKDKARSAAKLSRGGEIPAGYPHDSFPAWLTSGEKVLPAGVDSIGTQQREFKPVILRIEGRDLVGVLEEMDKFTRNY
jgi:TP901 family phage tail tape measure protein